MSDPRDLKIALLKAQLERALRYDPEWGPDAEDRPLGYIVNVEWRVLHGASPLDWVLTGIGGQIEASNRIFSALAKGRTFKGGDVILVPLTYATHDREITS